MLEHLVGLGVTAVELLPVQRSLTNGTLAARGLTNYWGYNTIGFFAPHEAYSAAARAGRPGGEVAEFQAMVRALHAAGLEVVYATTDPPLNAIRKVIPPLNLGSIRLDLAFMVLLIAVYILRGIVDSLAIAAA